MELFKRVLVEEEGQGLVGIHLDRRAGRVGLLGSY